MPWMSAHGSFWVASEIAAVSTMTKTIAMCPSRATYYATAERKVCDHPVTITERNCRMAASMMANALLGSLFYKTGST